jgi:long-chain acyl-CoA synthetase
MESTAGPPLAQPATARLTQPGVLRGADFVPTQELMIRGVRGASALASLGVAAGDAVALLLRNDHPMFEASFAISILGGSPVPLNWHGTPEEMGYILADCKAKVVIGHSDLLSALSGTVSRDLPVITVPTPPDIARAYGISSTNSDLSDSALTWSDWIQAFDPWSEGVVKAPSSMIYTSGTTGRPKGVRRGALDESDPAIKRALDTALDLFGIRAGARTVITGPMYHTAPNLYGLLAAREGAFVVLQPRFDAEELLRLINEHKITHLHMVPIMFVRLLRLPEAVRRRYDVSSLQVVAHAAAPCPPDVKRAMIDWWGPLICEYYGGTETGAVVACSSDEWLAHPGTVGRALPGAMVSILDDGGKSVPAGQAGDIYMRLKGWPDFTYENMPDARLEVEREGLITCGDVGYLDADGYLYLCDRKRDMIISGGVNIYPAEIEACLVNLAGVRDCAVFGVPDEEYGEAVAAAVELEDGARLSEEDVRAFIQSHLASFKAPRIVGFHQALPREDSGKIFKRKLREP